MPLLKCASLELAPSRHFAATQRLVAFGGKADSHVWFAGRIYEFTALGDRACQMINEPNSSIPRSISFVPTTQGLKPKRK
jgi:hypothetical protein